MANITLNFGPPYDRVIAELQQRLHTRTPQDAANRALLLAQILGQFSVDDIVTVVAPDNTIKRIYLPPNPWLPLLRRNQVLKGRHTGQRCVILANGPSAGMEDLKRLRGEVVFSVSRGYDHKDYDVLRPAYHFLPSIVPGVLDQSQTKNLLEDIQNRTGNAELFFGVSEEKFIREHGLFSQRTVYYVNMGGEFDISIGNGIFDLTNRIPSCQSVSIMCLLTALYMGFSEIYLLGVDHDDIRTGVYTYAFEPSFQHEDPSIDKTGRVTLPVYEMLATYMRLWQQYRAIKVLADRQGVKIYNVGRVSAVDEFPRVKFDEAFS